MRAKLTNNVDISRMFLYNFEKSTVSFVKQFIVEIFNAKDITHLVRAERNVTKLCHRSIHI